MTDIVPWLVGAALGAAIAALTLWSIWLYRRRKEIVVPTPKYDDDTYRILSVLRAAAVVVDADGEVVRASPPAYALGLVRDDELVQPAVNDLIDEVREDGVIREAELDLPIGPSTSAAPAPVDALGRPNALASAVGSGRVLLHMRVAPIGQGQLLVLAEDRTEAQRLETIRRDFLVNVSHELKTPVGAISLLTETVSDAADDPAAVRKFSAQLKKESDRLAVLVREIIELSRLQAPGALAEADPVPITDVVTEAIDRTRTAAEAKHIQITAGFAPRAAAEPVLLDTTTMVESVPAEPSGPQVYGDAGLLLTAVRNLLDNAVAYSPDHARVGVGIRERDGLIEIDVVDQGMGISPEEQERVFERFYRTDPARSRDSGGTGLGLSIVKHVAANHGGDVQVWSQVGQGSTFTLRLPALPTTSESAPDAAAGARETVAAGSRGTVAAR